MAAPAVAAGPATPAAVPSFGLRDELEQRVAAVEERVAEMEQQLRRLLGRDGA
jgi:uncharacterized protein YceH (UPF0502 family)